MAPRYMLVEPTHYDVSYSINPWMDPSIWAKDPDRHAAIAHEAFEALAQTLREAGAEVVVEAGVPGLPDMVFPANAGIVFDGRVLPARFRFPERQGEEKHLRAIFERMVQEGWLREIVDLPEGLLQEGAGDCLWDETRGFAWLGWGQRSDRESCDVIARTFGIETVVLRLATERFYHLDTCFHVLPRGEVLYYPDAFDAESLAKIEAHVPPEMRLEATAEDAQRFCVNAVAFDGTVVMAMPTRALVQRLEERGYEVRGVTLDPYILSGGGAYCMTLRLDRTTK